MLHVSVIISRQMLVSVCCIDSLMQFLKDIQFQRVAPKVYGACGRLVVVEHGGRLLSSYLDEPFSQRAELALQLLSMVQVFWVRTYFSLYCF